MTHTTRESWLRAACEALEPTLKSAGVGLADVRVSCGWPARGALSRVKRVIGECWHWSGTKDGQSHVFVSPVLDDPVETIGSLLHELIHAALPSKVKHGRQFARVALACGLEGKPTATVVGQGLRDRLHAEVLPNLGLYPHRALDFTAKPKQSTRMVLWLCGCAEPPKVRAAAKSGLDAMCNKCGMCLARADDKHEDGED